MSFTGFDPEAIKKMRNEIDKSAQDSCEAIINKLESGIITPISTCLYTPEGKKYFEGFAEDVAKTGTEIKKVFDSFVEGLEKTANYWAQNTDADTISLQGVTDCVMKLDVSSVKDKNGTQVGIVEQEAKNVVSKLPTVQSEIDDELAQIASKLDANDAFLGHGQAEAISNTFKKINKIVADIFNFLTEGDNSLSKQINNAVEKYGDVANQVQSSYSE